MIEISDLQDPRLDDYRDLRDADLRGARRLFTVESLPRGASIPSQRMAGGVPPARTGRCTAGCHRNWTAWRKRFRSTLRRRMRCDRSRGMDSHGGALALGRRDPRPTGMAGLEGILERPRLTIVAAEGVVHVDNMGSLFRNASCLGADAVLLSPTCADPLLRKTVRISTGRVFSLPWSFMDPWNESLERLKTRTRFQGHRLRHPCQIAFHRHDAVGGSRGAAVRGGRQRAGG